MRRCFGRVIRCRVASVPAALRERLKTLPDTRFTEAEGPVLELECNDVKTTLPTILASLTEFGVELRGLATQEPSLERVFFDLTKTTLRD